MQMKALQTALICLLAFALMFCVHCWRWLGALIRVEQFSLGSAMDLPDFFLWPIGPLILSVIFITIRMRRQLDFWRVYTIFTAILLISVLAPVCYVLRLLVMNDIHLTR